MPRAIPAQVKLPYCVKVFRNYQPDQDGRNKLHASFLLVIGESNPEVLRHLYSKLGIEGPEQSFDITALYELGYVPMSEMAPEYTEQIDENGKRKMIATATRSIFHLH